MNSRSKKWLSIVTLALLVVVTAACGGKAEPQQGAAVPSESAAPSVIPSPTPSPSDSVTPSATTTATASATASAQATASPSSSKEPEASKDDHGGHSQDDLKGDDKPTTKPSTSPKPAASPKPSGSPSPSPSVTPAQEDPIKIEIEDFAFSPAEIEITPGTKVEFVNKDKVKHTATADDGSFDTGLLGKGESKTVTFDEEGTFTFYCQPHPAMTGKIVVKSK